MHLLAYEAANQSTLNYNVCSLCRVRKKQVIQQRSITELSREKEEVGSQEVLAAVKTYFSTAYSYRWALLF